MTALYWNNQGKYQKAYDELRSQLIPDEGYCPTLAGELLRAISNLYYDHFNNGDCNNETWHLQYAKYLLLDYLSDNHNSHELAWVLEDWSGPDEYWDWLADITIEEVAKIVGVSLDE